MKVFEFIPKNVEQTREWVLERISQEQSIRISGNRTSIQREQVSDDENQRLPVSTRALKKIHFFLAIQQKIFYFILMLNQSNRNVPTRRVEFLNVTLRLVQSSVEDPTETQEFTTRVSADVDQALDATWVLSQGRHLETSFWNTDEVSVEHSSVSYTHQTLPTKA